MSQEIERRRSGISSSAESVEFLGHNFHITDDSEIGIGGAKS